MVSKGGLFLQAMQSGLKLYNTLHKQLEDFEPYQPPFVGLYLCGPTVYGDPHLGHSRGAVVIDILHRYLEYQGYKVRYVRNITDVGHLTDDSDDGEDKILKKARLEKVEPMEVAGQYTNSYHDMLRMINVLPPDIEPRASGHIIEQIQMIEKIIKNGFAYEVNGSVYFDLTKYAESSNYGQLSGKVLEDLVAGAGNERRQLAGQEEKRSPNDFALWKKADPEHIMKWPSPWSEGFPGWHIECSAMSAKYLGDQFDIHAGGMDLLFPHHESEIAQSTACYGHAPVKYWIHNNMITINGQKMAKSLGNGILLDELFSGDHKLLDQAYSPMTLRFFLLQAHYRSTLDFSNEALKAAEKGLARLQEAIGKLDKLPTAESSSLNPQGLKNKILKALNDDLNTPIAISHLFEGVKWVNLIESGKAQLTTADLEEFKTLMNEVFYSILGFTKAEQTTGADESQIEDLMQLLLEMRATAKSEKNFALADQIRDQLTALGYSIKDSKEGATYEYKA